GVEHRDIALAGVLHGLVLLRVERYSRLAEALEPEPVEGRDELVRNSLERPRHEVAVLTGPVEVVEQLEHLADHRGPRLLDGDRPFALLALAVVRVLGLQALQIARQLGDAGVDRVAALGVRSPGGGTGVIGRIAAGRPGPGLRGRVRLADLTGVGVDRAA